MKTLSTIKKAVYLFIIYTDTEHIDLTRICTYVQVLRGYRALVIGNNVMNVTQIGQDDKLLTLLMGIH
ncbi:hypothetical protein KCM76_20885 [Zooshikella marina]|uniref:hypothetical protein n=1 Tax=Zooshikella ganghwensis TaxID=202772 RepID=UPI001BAFDE5B|nr:hypothetical protein [Zooshikella ganghwensis]MBU2708462.1 hypothetical protein [Zooshikella ganghwensis]